MVIETLFNIMTSTCDETINCKSVGVSTDMLKPEDLACELEQHSSD